MTPTLIALAIFAALLLALVITKLSQDRRRAPKQRLANVAAASSPPSRQIFLRLRQKRQAAPLFQWNPQRQQFRCTPLGHGGLCWGTGGTHWSGSEPAQVGTLLIKPTCNLAPHLVTSRERWRSSGMPKTAPIPPGR